MPSPLHQSIETRPRAPELIVFPIIPRPNFADDSWIEQRQRELDGLSVTRFRTRPAAGHSQRGNEAKGGIMIHDREAGSIPTFLALSAFVGMLFVFIAAMT